ncbi:ATP-dependent DNA helicase [Mangrovibacillus cuniculi]|uniref:ATP-dependent DNA helicase n=1 Tax=Mangrovibacillus cuniculi TaxID=2593652 RepID=A0A7S8CAY9_9BACI|nr:ATP-dependent DNA helicase [Mangrovibacillus cuniculi]QPC46652.1 ATP-dependent DNA helicase [Mangrovibacillus cuniculi]
MSNLYPFTVSKDERFFDKLGEYIGDVFYDILPDKGYELRDEQIFMAYQVEQAFQKNKTIFAEAGVGTGKTFVYLLYSLFYARYKGKPAIIACSDETLIEQLVKKEGDIKKLEEALGLTIDVRLAKAREQYVCIKKLDELSNTTDNESILEVHDNIPDFVYDQSSMSRFYPYGDRKEYPWVSNKDWVDIAYDPLQQCSTCDWRHRCGQTLNREYYRHAKDLIICSHDFYMEHVWTKESRKREGQLPLLPEASCVIFDEGHLLEFAAQKALTYRFHADTITQVLTGYMAQDVREETLMSMERILELHDEWFAELDMHSEDIEGSIRRQVTLTDKAQKIAKTLMQLVDELMEQLVFDSELFTLDQYHVKMIEEYLEFFHYGLSILMKNEDGVFWLEENHGDLAFVIMPRLVEDILRKEVFSADVPFIFSSATMSQNGDFTYMMKNLGIEDALSFTVDSPFDYEEVMKINGFTEKEEETKFSAIKEDLKKNGGRSLVLFSSAEEMNRFRQVIQSEEMPFPMLFEGDEEISKMVEQFQREEQTVLCSYHLWEGLDVPGDSLTAVHMSSLPFPPHDPVFDAKRRHAGSAFEEVDLPFMVLRVRQGVGRLIRQQGDAGVINIWLKPTEDKLKETLSSVLPVSVEWSERV